MKKVLGCYLLCLNLLSASTATHIFVSPHQDDWQLFMGEFAWDAMLAQDQVVFVYLTAGEAGHDEPYWKTRENGALNSVRTTLGYDLGPNEIESHRDELIWFKFIPMVELANTRSYFLRLPDGNVDGKGFPKYGNVSMSQLAKGSINKLRDVKRRNEYSDYRELVKVLHHLIKKEKQTTTTIYTILPAPNLEDSHADHQATGQLVAAASRNLDVTVRYFIDYRTAELPRNLNFQQARKKISLFMAYDFAMRNEANFCEICIPTFNKWLYRSYEAIGSTATKFLQPE